MRHPGTVVAHLQDAASRQVVTAPLEVVPQAFEGLVYIVLLRPQPALQLSERNLLRQEPLPQILLGSPAKRSARCKAVVGVEQHWQAGGRVTPHSSDNTWAQTAV